MFKKCLFTSLFAGLLVVSSTVTAANDEIFTEEDLKLFPQQISDGYQKKVTIDFGTSAQTSKIIIEDGFCGQYSGVVRRVITILDTKKSTKEVAEKLLRIGLAAERQVKNGNCKKSALD